MDSTRAITPTLSDGTKASTGGGGMVRGKMLSYNTPKQKSGSGQEAAVGINIPPISVSSASNKATSVYPMAVAGSGAVAAAGVGGGSSNNNRRGGGGVMSTISPVPPDITVQGRNASSTIGKGVMLWTGAGSGKNENSQQQSQSGVNKGDLEPLCDEIPADGVVFARNKSIPGSLVVFRTQEEKLRNPEVTTILVMLCANVPSICCFSASKFNNCSMIYRD